MNFDKEVEKILSECVLEENAFDFIKGAIGSTIKNIGKGYADVFRRETPLVTGAIEGGIESVKKKKEAEKKSKTLSEAKIKFSNKVAKDFLQYRFQVNPKKRIKIYGTSYEMPKLLNMLNGKILLPKIDGKIIKTVSQLNTAKKIYNDLKKAASLIKNKNLNDLNLLNNQNLKGLIEAYIEEKKQVVESYILEKKSDSENKNDEEKEITVNYDQITTDDVLKSMANIIKVPFSSSHPSYLQQKLQYLFALVNDGQVIR